MNTHISFKTCFLTSLTEFYLFTAKISLESRVLHHFDKAECDERNVPHF